MKKHFFTYSMALIFIFGTLFFGGDAKAVLSNSVLVETTLRNELDIARENTPLSWSLPLSQEDNIHDVRDLQVFKDGKEMEAQFTPLARWGGSVQDPSKPISIVLVDANVNMAPKEKATITLKKGFKSYVPSKLQVLTDNDESIVINTGVAEFEISKKQFRFFDLVSIYDGTLSKRVYFSEVNDKQYGIRLNDSYRAYPAQIHIEHIGPNRISLLVHGKISEDLGFTARLHFHKNLGDVKVDFQLVNQSMQQGGESVQFEDLTLGFIAQGLNYYRIPGRPGQKPEIYEGVYQSSVSLYQDSSGNAYWNVHNINNNAFESGVQKKNAVISINSNPLEGADQIFGWFDSNNITVALENPWQNFPKALRAKDNRLEVGLFPKEYSKEFSLPAKQSKTHSFWLRYHTDVASDVQERAESALVPLHFDISADVLAQKDLGLLSHRFYQSFPSYESGVDAQLVKSNEHRPWENEATDIKNSIARSGLYGIFSYGELPFDSEGKFQRYGIQKNVLRGMLYQSMRASEETLSDEWLNLLHASARYSGDKNNQEIYAQGGAISGMFLYSVLSGDTLLFESARGAAETLVRSLEQSDYGVTTGSAKSSGLQKCDQLGCNENSPMDTKEFGANNVSSLLYAYAFTGEERYKTVLENALHYIWSRDISFSTATLDCRDFDKQLLFVDELGQSILLREKWGLSEDPKAKDIFAQRIRLMKGKLWNPEKGKVNGCKQDNTVDAESLENNIQLAVADIFGMGSILLGDSTLLNTYAKQAFDYGTKNQSYEGSANAYHFVQEFVRQVSFGHAFQYVWSLYHGDVIDPDTTPTKIQNIRISNITTGQARVLWSTNETASSVVLYGTQPDTLDKNIGLGSRTTQHGVILPNLQRATTYYFQIESVDEAGNVSKSDIQNFQTIRSSEFVFHTFDNDQDGFSVEVDCDDNNKNIHPGRDEILGNGIDDDCNAGTTDTGNNRIIQFEAEQMSNISGIVFERLEDSVALYSNGYVEQGVYLLAGDYNFEIAARGDIFPNLNAQMKLSIDGKHIKTFDVNSKIFGRYSVSAHVEDGVHIIRMEFSNDVYNPPIDNNLYLDKLIVELKDLTLKDDKDADGYTRQFDCNDNDPQIHPGMIEIPYDNKDNDCRSDTKDNDKDGDGYLFPQDCNDEISSIHPGANEILLDGIDNDCDPDTGDFQKRYTSDQMSVTTATRVQKGIQFKNGNESEIHFTPPQPGCYVFTLHMKPTNLERAYPFLIQASPDNFPVSFYVNKKGWNDYRLVRCFSSKEDSLITLRSAALAGEHQLQSLIIASYEREQDSTAPQFLEATPSIQTGKAEIKVQTSENVAMRLLFNNSLDVYSGIQKDKRTWTIQNLQPNTIYTYTLFIWDIFGNMNTQEGSFLTP